MDKDDNYIENDDMLHSILKIPDCSIDLIVSDPPYGTNRKNDGYDDSYDYVFSINDQWMYQMNRVLKEGSHIYLFVPTIHVDKWILSVRKYFTFKNLIATQCFVNNRFFTKNNNNYCYDAQYIIFAHKGNGRILNHVNWIPTSKSWFHDKRNKNQKEFTYIYPNYIYYDLMRANLKANGQYKKLHQNEKNPELIAKFIEVSSNPNDVVADFFMGSGTTAIACLMTGRKYIGSELNLDHYNTTIERINNFKNNKKKSLHVNLLSYFQKKMKI
ncbi:MAG: site-specific DNA-methyltransferase [Acidithiobacillus sp.]|jgi:DNA modification methylase|uniref:DNA-methyltransferase n=1 Tax=Acidithiobacillus sp. TaxID=1872118 RepID=UPI003560E0BA